MEQTSLFTDNNFQKNDHPSFYNTIHETGTILQKSISDAKTQEDTILELFQKGGKYTPLAVERVLKINHDSCKRAINVLTKKGKLIKLGKEQMVMESRGKMNHRWELKK